MCFISVIGQRTNGETNVKNKPLQGFADFSKVHREL